MYRIFRYPLRPTAAQVAVLELWLSQCRELYNAALYQRKDAWRKQRVLLGYNDQCKEGTEWRRGDEVARSVPCEVQRSALRRVDRAFKDFFRRARTGQKPGFPRYRNERRYNSFTVPGRLAPLKGGRLQLRQGFEIKAHVYRPLRGRVARATVRRELTGKWFVCFECDIGAAPEKVEPRTFIGIDVGLRSLAVTSDGEVIENPRHAARSAAELARLQRVLARRKRGSKSRERARVQVAKAYRRDYDRRRDHAWKLAGALVSRCDVIAYEDLGIARLARGICARGINDAGWGILLHCIACKAEEAGKHVVAVDPSGTSQRCSGCGEAVPKDLSVRIHDCPHCGIVLDRDHNAAINICALGRSAVSEAGALASPQAPSG